MLLADDYALVAESLARLLSREHDLVAVVNTAADLVASAIRLRPEVIVTDLQMPGIGGMDAMKQLKAARVSSKIIFLSMREEPWLAGEALQAGAAGYVLKTSVGDELFTAIREVLAGRVYLTPRITREEAMARRGATTPLHRLTRRQREVLKLVVSGRTIKEVASDLSLSPRTVESHKYDLMHTLGVQTTVELVRYAIQHGV